MSKLTLAQLAPIISETLRSGNTVTFTPSGNSMYPFLRDKENTVTVKSPDFPLSLYDIALFYDSDRRLVLHRVIATHDGYYDFCGDNRFVPEKNIPQSDILGVVVSVGVNGENINLSDKNYIKYCEKLAKRRKKLQKKASFAHVLRRAKNVFNKLFGKKKKS